MNHVLIDSFSAQHILDEEVQLEPSSFAAPRTHFAESTFKQSVVYPGIPKHGFMGEGGTERSDKFRPGMIAIPRLVSLSVLHPLSLMPGIRSPWCGWQKSLARNLKYQTENVNDFRTGDEEEDDDAVGSPAGGRWEGG